MNLVLKTIDVFEEEIGFVDKYVCICSFQSVTDYIYFRDILTVSYDLIPNSILKYFKNKI
ncbi:MAG: hypothetical protein ACRC3I_05210 [Cetobacterium sp.]